MTRTYKPGTCPLTLDEGVPLAATVTVPLIGVEPSDTYTAELTIARSGVEVLSTTPAVTEGTDEVTVSLVLTASQTEAFDFDGADYQLDILTAGVVVCRPMSGRIVVRRGVVS